MISEVNIVEHVNNVVRSIGILLPQLVENTDFDKRLMMEALLVANYFDCHVLICFVIEGTYDLSEASLSDDFENFITIADVIVNHLCKRGEKEDDDGE